jgi:PTS system cellobiose-specific IIB component
MMGPKEASMRILVVCGAGASSTFVAQRINKAARAQKLAYSATATNEASLAEGMESSDLVLLGPHLAARLEQVKGLAAPHGVTVVLLDADVFADLDGTRTVARIEAAVRDGST